MIKTITSLAGFYLNTMAHVFPGITGMHGLKLFCRPFRLPLKKYQKEFFDTADLFSFEYDGIDIQGYRWGDGEKKILFLHGWQSHTFRWKNYIEALPKDQYTIYSIDAPGHGLSGGSFLSVPYYSAVIQQLIGSLGDIHAVVGHSLGSFSALHAFYQQEKIPVEKLVLMAPPGEASDFISFYQQQLKLSDKSVDLILKTFEKEFQKPITYFSTSKFAVDVNVPGLIIHDEDDLEAPYHYAKKINEHWPQSKLITTKGLGHNLKSKEIVNQVLDFINSPLSSINMKVFDTVKSTV
jgi:pimeloyl-ACP methyl ester carboxylesterase